METLIERFRNLLPLASSFPCEEGGFDYYDEGGRLKQTCRRFTVFEDDGRLNRHWQLVLKADRDKGVGLSLEVNRVSGKSTGTVLYWNRISWVPFRPVDPLQFTEALTAWQAQPVLPQTLDTGSTEFKALEAALQNLFGIKEFVFDGAVDRIVLGKTAQYLPLTCI